MDEANFPNGAVVADILGILNATLENGYDQRIPTLPDENPLAPLGRVINVLLDELEASKQKKASNRRELEQLRTLVELQRATIRSFSTPIIEIWHRVLCLPLVGDVNAERGEAILNTLLSTVLSRQPRYVIVDVTGISAIGNNMAQWLLGLTRVVHLLGVKCVLAGIQGELAIQLVEFGVDLEHIETHSNVREALEQWIRLRPSVTK